MEPEDGTVPAAEAHEIGKGPISGPFLLSLPRDGLRLTDVCPYVSVIMPVRNEAGFIGRSLACVLAQDYAADRMEVIVSDGMSSDGTRELVHTITMRDPRVSLVDNPGRIAPTALNAGVVAARGEVIVRVDGHTEIAPDYVTQCVLELRRSGADNVGDARFHYSNREEWVDTVYMGAWRREVFDRIGLFDEEQVRNQDDEFNYRLREAGGQILLSPRIRSRYEARGTLTSLWKQYFQYGYWKVRVLQKHPLQMRARQFVPPLFVLSLLVSGAGALALPGVPAARLPLAVLATLYVAADLIAATAAAMRERANPLLLAVVFPVLHLAYGSGFLAGLVHFGRRWGENPSSTAVRKVPG